MKLNPNIPPPNGFVFKESDGTVFRAASLKALARKLLVYRTQNGGNTNDLEHEVEEQICKSVPDHCHGDGSPRAVLRSLRNRQISLKSRLIGYLGTMSKVEKPAKATQTGTAERIRVCLKCPKRHTMQENCGGCRKSIEALRKKCLGGDVPIAPNLGACDVLGSDLAVAVHLNEPRVSNEQLPANCWRKA